MWLPPPPPRPEHRLLLPRVSLWLVHGLLGGVQPQPRGRAECILPRVWGFVGEIGAPGSRSLGSTYFVTVSLSATELPNPGEKTKGTIQQLLAFFRIGSAACHLAASRTWPRCPLQPPRAVLSHHRSPSANLAARLPPANHKESVRALGR